MEVNNFLLNSVGSVSYTHLDVYKRQGQTDNKMNIYGSYGMQLMGFTHAPRVMYFGADMPFTLFNKQHGVGVGFFNEGIGLFRNQRFWGQYAYQMKIRKGKFCLLYTSRCV